MKRLVRFRADPEKVRVAVRRAAFCWWQVTISDRTTGRVHGMASRSDPVLAVDVALQKAAETLDGCDLGMEWAYSHPWLEEPVGEERLEQAVADAKLYAEWKRLDS